MISLGMVQMMNSLYAIHSHRKNGFVCFHLGLQPFVALFRADTVETVVTSTSNLSKGTQYGYLKPWLGMGLLTR